MPLGTATIRARIYVGFAVVLALLGVQLWVALRGIDRLRDLRREIVETYDPPSSAAQDLEHGVLSRAIALRNYVATGVREHRDEYERLLAMHGEEIANVESMPLDAESRRAIATVALASRQHVFRSGAFLSLYERRAPAAQMAEAELRLTDARAELLSRIREFDEIQGRRQTEAGARMAGTEREVAAALLVAALLVAVALGLTAVLTTRAVQGPALLLVGAAEAVERGEYAAALALAPPRGRASGELQQLGAAFGRMADTLRRREQRVAAEGRLAAALAGSLDPETTAASALDVIVDYTGAEAAAVHVAETGGLRRVAARGVDPDPGDCLPRVGILADALASGRVSALEVPGDLPFAVHAGFGSVRPRHVLVVPLASRCERIGVLLLGSIRAMSSDATAFAERAGGQLGIALQNALSHVRIGAFAAELRERAALLQTKNEELQAQSEEIQAQSEELHAQGDEIRRHNEELSAAKDALATKAAALEDVDRRKNEFLATLGHELRNPLAAVATAGALLEAEARDGRMSRHAAVIARQVRNLRRLVDDLLDLSRIDHGKIELRRERLDVSGAIEATIHGMRSDVEAKGQVVSFRPASGAPIVVEADPVRLEQIFSNLLRNAVKYTPARGTITVGAEAEGASAVVRVGDNGVGISPDLLPRIFEPFIQGTHSEGGEQGLGLGLALVRRLVEMHGGTVEARSEGEGTGTMFVVRLPLAAPARQAPAAAAPAEVELRRNDGHRTRVLLIEDDPDVAMTTADALELCGFAVRVESDADAGLRACLEQPPDVALLDIGLQGRSGHDLARDIRARLPRSAVRLVAVTGYGLPEDRARAEEAGFDLHLVKPVGIDELRDAIERLAGERLAGVAVGSAA